MTITKENDQIRIGADFVDAVTGIAKSHGSLELSNHKRFKWTSTADIASTESALRASTLREGVRITFFCSQAI